MPEPRTNRTQRPCGTWPSPVTPGVVAGSSLRLGAVAVDGDDIYWIEGRPMEAGRMVVVRREVGGRTSDATPPGTNVRSRVHEYGGAAFAVSQGVVYFSEFSDGRLYRLEPEGRPEPLTADSGGDCFYADVSIDLVRRRLVCVREDHRAHDDGPINSLVIVPLDGPATLGETFVEGRDFYATPRLKPDGDQLCWLAWRHPRMPWEGSELWIADLGPDGAIRHARTIAGGDEESIFQPGWTADGILYFASDRSGWWNLYRWSGGNVEPVFQLEAECGRPQWQLGTSTWAASGEHRLAVTYGRQGHWHVATLDRSTGTLERVPCQAEPGDSIAATVTHAVFVGGWTRSPDAVVRVDLRTGAVEPLRGASTAEIDVEFISEPGDIEFPTTGGLTAHAFFYAPESGEYVPVAGERPPLVVISHGGPTAATYARLNPEIQFWTSRGFAVVDVNYGGSAGFGRRYRERLRGQWGIVDVDDCVNAATWLADRGHVDRNRMVIRGRSAGGYTTLAALVFRPGVFRAGASYYGIGDLERLAADTHKFEQHYLDGLVGPYPAAAALYRARSPIHFADRITCPLILFQGLEDRVVPPNQAVQMAEAVRAQGHEAVLVTFEGEQHGFRRADSIQRCLTEELAFYTRVLRLI